MAIIYSSTVKDIVQEAFNLLRQDFSAPAATDADIDAVTDTSMEWGKAKLSLKTAANEVFDAFGWGSTYTAEGIGSWLPKMRNALVYTLARELAIPIAGRIEDMKIFASMAVEKLNAAKVRAVNDALDAISDDDTEEVVAQLMTSYTGKDVDKLPHSVASLTNRITTLKETARQDVLLAHDWNFAREYEIVVGACNPCPGDDFGWAYPYPPKMLRLLAAFGHRGRLNEWKIENGQIMAREPITKICYEKDVSDLSRWSPIARPLFVMRLKALVSRTIMDNVQDSVMQQQLYEKALESAKLQDAREVNRAEDVWGDNHHVEAMRGHVDGYRRDWPFRR